jgi:hypothetical protein
LLDRQSKNAQGRGKRQKKEFGKEPPASTEVATSYPDMQKKRNRGGGKVVKQNDDFDYKHLLGFSYQEDADVPRQTKGRRHRQQYVP